MLFRFYPLVIVIQIFCIYHAYKNNADQKWYWFIIFFPLIGSIFYLYDQFYSKQNIEALSETIKNNVNTNRVLEKLETEVKHADSILNKTNLADKYAELNRYDEAIELYESCLTSFNKHDIDIQLKIMHCYYHQENYAQVIQYGKSLENHKSFDDSEAKITYAWAHYHMGKTDLAKALFESMDHRYSNYPHRIEYARFLNEIGQNQAALDQLDHLEDEFQRMESFERKSNRPYMRMVKQTRLAFNKK